MRTVVGTTVALIVGAGALVSCGVTQDSQVRPLRERIPFGLSDPTTTSTSTIAPTTTAPRPTTTVAPTTTAAPTFPVRIYLVDGSNRLQPVDRSLPGRPTAENRLATLTGGTVGGDPAAVRSVANGAVFNGVRVQGGTAIVSVGSGYNDLDPTQAMLATAQVVFTLTELPGVGLVRLVANEEPISAVRADGSAADGVSQDDYRTLLGS